MYYVSFSFIANGKNVESELGFFSGGKGYLFLCWFESFIMPFQKALMRLLMQNVLSAYVWVWAASKAVAQCFVLKILD